jgi:hypothetical protein
MGQHSPGPPQAKPARKSLGSRTNQSTLFPDSPRTAIARGWGVDREIWHSSRRIARPWRSLSQPLEFHAREVVANHKTHHEKSPLFHDEFTIS